MTYPLVIDDGDLLDASIAAKLFVEVAFLRPNAEAKHAKDTGRVRRLRRSMSVWTPTGQQHHTRTYYRSMRWPPWSRWGRASSRPVWAATTGAVASGRRIPQRFGRCCWNSERRGGIRIGVRVNTVGWLVLGRRNEPVAADRLQLGPTIVKVACRLEQTRTNSPISLPDQVRALPGLHFSQMCT